MEPLVQSSRRGHSFGAPIGGGSKSQLIMVPHATIFPDPETELPTFNSNSILCSLHRIPNISEWFLYSDDDTILTRRDSSINAWWDSEHEAQRLYLTHGRGVHRRRPRLANNWEEALTYMSGLLDEVKDREPENTTGRMPRSARHIRRYTSDPQLCKPTAIYGRPSIENSTSRHPLLPLPSRASTMPGAAVTAAPLPDAISRRHHKGLMRYYARPQHMPVLMSRDLIFELEHRWPAEFERTRRHRLRLGEELELNFFYHHYLRIQQFAVTAMSSDLVEFLYMQNCAGHRGELRCGRILSDSKVRFATFNDDATNRQEFSMGLGSLHKLLTARFGTFAQ